LLAGDAVHDLEDFQVEHGPRTDLLLDHLMAGSAYVEHGGFPADGIKGACGGAQVKECRL
jgi:hypothetical protein